MDKLRFGLFTTMLASGLLVPVSGFAQDSIGISVIIRDFQPSHPDFENFDRLRPEMRGEPRTCAGKADMAMVNGISTTPLNLPTNEICQDGTQGPCTMAPQLEYGIGVENGLAYKGFVHEIRAAHPGAVFSGVQGVLQTDGTTQWAWSEPVYVTKGMVAPDLAYRLPPSDPDYEYSAYPQKAGSACDNTYFDQWFQSIDPSAMINFEIKDVLYLYRETGTNRYTIDSKTGPYAAVGAYFPLDKFDGSTTVPNWGKQSYKTWCPYLDAAHQKADQQSDLCKTDWIPRGGPKGGNVDKTNPFAHNYAFTLMGYTQFTYTPGEVFEFAGDDDMWIFIDGKLVVDLGGIHLPAPSSIAMDALAAVVWGNTDWSAGSQHKLHFFYADRQSDDSNLRITTTLSKVSVPRYGQPTILAVERSGSTAADLSLTITTNTDLSQQTINDINNGVLPYALLYKRQASANAPLEEYGLNVVHIEFLELTSEGYKYSITWDKSSYKPLLSDSLSFNMYRDSVVGKDYNNPAFPQVTSSLGKPVVALSYAKVTGVSAVLVTDVSEVPVDLEALPFDAAQIGEILQNGGSVSWGGGSPGSGIGAGSATVAGTGGGAGKIIPVSKTGEILMTVYPQEEVTDTNWEASNPSFGLPGGADLAGFINPIGVSSDGSPQFLKGAFGDNTGSSAVAVVPGLCKSSTDLSTGESKGNCLMVQFDTYRPFKVNVNLFDHTGQFVTRYTQEVSAQELANVQKSRGTVDGVGTCTMSDGSVESPVSNAKVKAVVQIYPISSTGRKIGTGVYIMQVDIIQQKYEVCTLVGGDATSQGVTDLYNEPFSRSHEEVKIGYIRTK